MKILSITLFSLLVLFITATILFSPYVLFDVERTNKGKLSLKNCDIVVDYVTGNATMEDVLQIRLQTEDIDTVLANYQQYSTVKSIQSLNDSLVEIVMGDSINSYSIKTDTVVVPIRYR